MDIPRPVAFPLSQTSLSPFTSICVAGLNFVSLLVTAQTNEDSVYITIIAYGEEGPSFKKTAFPQHSLLQTKRLPLRTRKLQALNRPFFKKKQSLFKTITCNPIANRPPKSACSSPKMAPVKTQMQQLIMCHLLQIC